LLRHHYYVNTAKFKEAEVLLIGGDHIALLGQSQFYCDNLAPLHCFCFGSMGDTISNLLWRIEDGEIDNYTPKAIVVSIGESDFELTPDQVVAGYEAICESVMKHQPEAKIFFLEMLPCGRIPNERWEFVLEVNKKMKLRLGHKAEVIEMDAEAIKNQGSISINHMFDFFHLSQVGYEAVFWPVVESIQIVLGLPFE